MKLTFAIPKATASTIFSCEEMERLSRLTEIISPPFTQDPSSCWSLLGSQQLEETEILITGWKTPPLTKELISQMPRLALVANASGGVRGHLPVALWEGGIPVITASQALGWGVAEFSLATMLLAAKRAFWLAQGVRERGEWREESDCFGGGFELFGADVGIIGAGQSGQQLLRLLAPFQCRLWVYDPFAEDTLIASLGAKRLSTLEALFERCRVVSLHAALTSSTRQMIRGHHFRRLPAGSVFLNTARAGLIHEEEMIEALAERRFVACIDVAAEEPPSLNHPLRHLPNVLFTPHIAGAIQENRLRMGRLIVDEVERFIDGQPLHHEVLIQALSAIA